MTYAEILNHLEKLELFGTKFGLDNITRLCEALGNPQDSYKIIHVAGTNGKGSVVAMCAEILKACGNTGMYVSPHLQTFRERMQVNGEMITEREVIGIFEEVKKAADKLDKHPTYFDFITAMAFLFFKQKECEFAVIETGMGGRLDSTNIVKSSVAVITNIELDHKDYLGDTKEKIAVEKAGIIKESIPTVVGEPDEKIKKLLYDICDKKNSEFVEITKDYNGETSLLGKHQKKNAALAFAAVKKLGINDEEIKKGIAKTKWPGRIEIVQENPRVVLDVAHNPAGAEILADYLKNTGKEIILVLGISEDKEKGEMVKTLAPLAKKIIITKTKYYRGGECKPLKEEALKYNDNVEIVEDVKEAVGKATSEAKEDVVVVTGSIFVVGEARERWFKF